MTFDDDTIILVFTGGKRYHSVKKLNLSWPPPEHVEYYGFRMRRSRMSEITDEQRRGMTHVARCAEYVVDE